MIVRNDDNGDGSLLEGACSPSDLLWPYFSVLWPKFSGISPDIQLFGGYSMHLRMQSLLRGESSEALIHPNKWLDVTYRPPKDLDFMISTEALIDPVVQRRIDSLLSTEGYEVVPTKKRWQFEKFADDGHRISVDFMTNRPPEGSPDFKISRGRVKPRSELRHLGVHGRYSHECPAHLLYPAVFVSRCLELRCVSPLPFIRAKIEGMGKMWDRSREERRPEVKRQIKTHLAIKHGTDIYMILAMMSSQDMEVVPEVLKLMRLDPTFGQACATAHRILMDIDSPINREALRRWRLADLERMRNLLFEWFPSDSIPTSAA